GRTGRRAWPRVRVRSQVGGARSAAVSMRRIAAEVGLQAGALYLYTTDKQALLYELMETHLDDLLAAWQREDPGGDPLTRLEAFVRFHIRFNLDRPDAVFIAYMELRNLTKDNFARISALRGRYEGTLKAILADGQAGGVFATPDTKLATLAMIAMLTGVNTWYREGGRLSRADIEQIYWDMVRKAVSA
ncbi:MAG TPA: TetR/AcrR family transcriptional regulator, partial [Kiloniellaceae bacterium]|nr:TetR/AcrR family transcriptional regulator [Kiloniellaceae bacterium]